MTATEWILFALIVLGVWNVIITVWLSIEREENKQILQLIDAILEQMGIESWSQGVVFKHKKEDITIV